jgi:hypothetical protein
MSTTRTIDSITARDGTRIHFTDWSHGTPVVFATAGRCRPRHGKTRCCSWPITAIA